MLAWLYTHISLGHKGAFLFGFTTAVMLMLVFLGKIATVWCKECLRASEFSGVAKKRKGSHLEGITKVEEGLFSNVVRVVCLFRLLFVSTACAGWMAGWFAVLTDYYRFVRGGKFDVLMWVGLACCGVAIASGVFSWVLTR